MLYADVILPLALPKPYTYSIPPELSGRIKTGQRVLVQFGGSSSKTNSKGEGWGKQYSAIVKKIHSSPPANYLPKKIESILDEEPLINEMQFAFWEWMSSYYMCTMGEVMNAALPSGLKLSSETKIIPNEEYKINPEELSDEEYLIAEALETSNSLSILEASEILGKKNVFPVIKSLIEKNVIVILEEINEKYKPKTEQFVRLKENLNNEKILKKIFDSLEKAPKQLEVLMVFVQMSRLFSESHKEVKKTILQKNSKATSSTLNLLVEKNIFEIYEKEVGRFNDGYQGEKENFQLNNLQTDSLEKIKNQFPEKEVILLHGVTSSGKTEIYFSLIDEALRKGKQVLYLLPEIALTIQMINRLTKRFGNQVCVYHSRFNQNEKVELWKMASGGRPENKEFPEAIPIEIEINKSSTQPCRSGRLFIGARSAVFLPFYNLGLVIVDEEHENSFKQFDPSPRYHARDSALILAKIHKAKTILGSATPSIETYHNALNGKFGLVEMTERFGGVQLPEIITSDVKEESRKKTMKSHFSSFLANEIQMALNNREQVILFQNRRGFAPFLQCDTCSEVPHCTRCDVKLTYHKRFSELRCHYCGYKIPHPKACMACGDVNLTLKGFGTEKIEEEILLLFPNAKTGRLDLDTTRSKNSYRQIIYDFEEQNIEILVGTQMVTKGLDFENVALVGIMNADQMLYFPDFRANERSFQLMAQVAGRAGRKNKRGKVIIQTYSPGHPVIKQVIENDYSAFYQKEISERKFFNYPPFCRLIEITLKHVSSEKINEAAVFLAGALRKKFGQRVLGPEFPPVARIKNMYHKNILLKIEKEASSQKAKEILWEEINNFKREKGFSSVRVSMDVDPM